MVNNFKEDNMSNNRNFVVFFHGEHERHTSNGNYRLSGYTKMFNNEDVCDFIAKKYNKSPHEYVITGWKELNDEDFTEFTRTK